MVQPTIALNNDVKMPALGFGVYRSAPAETASAVRCALDVGYRLIDTAAAYLNEREVGEAIRESGVPRQEIFLTTKLWISDYGYDRALRAFDVSLRKLGLDYLDLYLLHQPVPTDFAKTIAAYQAVERLLAEGRVRAIGVSNFSIKHLDDLAAASGVVPAVNQVEVHPFFTNSALRSEHDRRGIVTEAWSPLGGVNVYMPADSMAVADPMKHPVVLGLAEKHARTPAQILLRWHMDSGIAAIPKSVRPERIRENFDVFGFSLTADERAAIDALNTNRRGGPDPEKISPKVYSLVIPD